MKLLWKRCIAALALVTCGATWAQDASGQLSGTLKKARDTGAITIGYREASLPFSYANPRGEPIGYSIDLCRNLVEAAADQVGRELTIKWVKVTSATRFEALVSNTIDLECGSTTNNTERQKVVSFSPTTFVAGHQAVGGQGRPHQVLP